MNALLKRIEDWVDEMLCHHFIIFTIVLLGSGSLVGIPVIEWLFGIGPWSPYAPFL